MKKMKKRKRFPIVRVLLFLAFLGVFLFAVSQLWISYQASKTAESEFAALSRQLATPQPSSGTAAPGLPTASSPSGQPDMGDVTDVPLNSASILPKFEKLLAQNPDLGGWITIPGTVVDYPVMFTPDDPEKYLHLSFDGKESKYGVPFIGAGCAILPRSDNIIIYSHHMRDGSMFAGLEKYADPVYLKAHPYIQFSTLYDEGTYQIFAAIRTDLAHAPDLRLYSFINASDEADFDSFLSGIRAAALYDAGVGVSYGDSILTLSTCGYQTTDGRFVVLAKRVEPQ